MDNEYSVKCMNLNEEEIKKISSSLSKLLM